MQINKELIEKYLNNRCNEEDLKTILYWFQESSKTSDSVNLLSGFWEEISTEEGPRKTDFDMILDKIHHKINLAHSEKILGISDNNFRKYKRKQYLIALLRNAAAILLLPAIGFGLFITSRYHSVTSDQKSLNQAYNEVFSSVDAITKVTLPDGSNVWLNHSSSLKYPAAFYGNTRFVELKGEGYFEVVHNTRIPFIVKAGEISVLARGTTFDISAYPDEDRIETSLIEGNVELKKYRPDGSTMNLLSMKPNDMVVYKKATEEIGTRTVKDDRYFSWKGGKLVFNKEPMSEVIKKLSRWYNVEIRIEDSELYNLTYTATFMNETLPQVLELIAMVTPVRYTISNRKEISPGVFSKRTVVLHIRNKK